MKAFRIATMLAPVFAVGFSVVGVPLPSTAVLGQNNGAADVPSPNAVTKSAGDQEKVGRVQPTVVGRKRLRDVVGFVVDEEDVPISGATVVLRERESWFHSEPPHWPSPRADLASRVTDAEGFFEFSGIYGHSDEKKLDVVAWAESYGTRWWHIPRDDLQPRNTLQLPSECHFRGVIVDHLGEPARNATVQLSHVMPIDQLATLDLDNHQWPDEDLEGYLMAEGSDHMPMVKTDNDGEFIMTSLPRDAGVILRVAHAKYAIARMFVATTESIAINRDLAKRTLHNQDGQLKLKRPRQVTVRVVCDDSGLPAVGARVRQFPDRRGNASPTELTGDCTVVYNHVVTEDVHFMILPPVGSDYLEAHDKLKIPVDDYDVKHTIRIHKGRVIPGRVVDSKTGNGVANATLLGIGGSRTRPPARFDRAHGPVVTDADGYFRFPVLPETQAIAVVGYVAGYRTPQHPALISHKVSANVPADSTPNLEFALDPVPHVTGTVRDPAGRPVPQATVSARVAVCDSAVLVVSEKTDAQGRYSLDQIYSPIYEEGDYERTHVEFTSQDGTLSGRLELPPWQASMGSEDQVFDVIVTPVP